MSNEQHKKEASSTIASPPPPSQDIDIFRDTYLRYMGYANEIGESFRSMISSKAVAATYAVAFGYVLCDVADKANKTYKAEKAAGSAEAAQRTAAQATDCFVWQTLASVLVPGFTINRICKLSAFLIHKSNVSGLVRVNKPLTTAIGLCSIPLIIHPIDHAIHVAMDKTVRPVLGVQSHYKD